MSEEPPLILVKTWYELLLHGENQESKSHAENMLIGAFGSQQAVADYLKKHKLV